MKAGPRAAAGLVAIFVAALLFLKYCHRNQGKEVEQKKPVSGAVAVPADRPAAPARADGQPFQDPPGCLHVNTPEPWPAISSLESAGGGRDDFIDCCASSGLEMIRHEGNKNALDNVVALARKGGKATLVGHGQIGGVCTGYGDWCTHADNARDFVLAYWDVEPVSLGPGWGPLTTGQVPGLTDLRLVSCSAGADVHGVEFVSLLANRLNCSVTARTYLVWCFKGRIWLDSRGEWQEASPNRTPTPKPTPNVVVSPSGVQVQLIGLDYLPDGGGPVNVGQLTIELRNNEGEEIVSLIDLANACVTPARAAGAYRGQLRVLIGQNPTVRTLRIIGDYLLQDADRRDRYYYVDSRFPGALRAFVSKYSELKRVTPPAQPKNDVDPLMPFLNAPRTDSDVARA